MSEANAAPEQFAASNCYIPLVEIAETEPKPEAVVGCKTWVGDEPQASNIDLGKDRITTEIRVSTAALLREDWWGKWWLVETWIFSDDPRQKSRQIIHGDCGAGGGRPPHERICATARKVHRYVVENLRRRFANVETGAESPTEKISGDEPRQNA